MKVENKWYKKIPIKQNIFLNNFKDFDAIQYLLAKINFLKTWRQEYIVDSRSPQWPLKLSCLEKALLTLR